MPKKANDDAVAIKAGTYHIECKKGTANVTVPRNVTALEIIQCLGSLLDKPSKLEAMRHAS